MEVLYGQIFLKHFQRFPKNDKLKIAAFIVHVQEYGLVNLQGRNKPSDHVPTNDPNWLQKVKYAQQYNLWHYHIGIPCYTHCSYGNDTSEYVLHYIRGDGFIKLVALSPHPPLALPQPEYLV